MTSQQLIIQSRSSKKGLTVPKVLKVVGIVALGFVVFATKHAWENSKLNSHAPHSESFKAEARRSLDEIGEKIQFDSTNQKQEATPSRDIQQKLNRGLNEYIITAEPQSIVYKQNPQTRYEFQSKMKKQNVTRWQYPDYVHVPLSDLGVVFLNGQRFFRQGSRTPPEFRNNGTTGADTRANGDRKCGLGYHKQPKQESSLISQRALPSQQDKQPAQQVGCCNGIPYNTNRRCCCRRASFDKDSKFCCAVNGCQDFRIMRRDDLTAREQCTALNGIVVEEYGYHGNTASPGPSFENSRPSA